MAELSKTEYYQTLSPAEKLEILAAMGFIEKEPYEHAISCFALRSLLACDCIPPASTWRAPQDVLRYIGQTREEREAFGRKRQSFLNEGVGQNPGAWSDHIEHAGERGRNR